jgi:tetratricopeptide (TPR) repeat protein
LMSRAKKAIDDNNYDLALRLLDAVIEIKPEYTEAWNRRATVYFLKKDYGNSLADLGKVLTREPRHFGALSGLGLIMQDIGDDKRALDAYRKALDVYPRLKGVSDKVKSLVEKVEGRDI